MIDRVYGRDLPDMQDWSRALLEEAVRCKVSFGVLVPGQGMVTARMLRATPSARMAQVRVTHDPRGWLEDVEFPAEMRYISEIRQAGSGFSLMRAPRVSQSRAVRDAATVQAARRLLARATGEAARGSAEGSASGASALGGGEGAKGAGVSATKPRPKPEVRRILRFNEPQPRRA